MLIWNCYWIKAGVLQNFFAGDKAETEQNTAEHRKTDSCLDRTNKPESLQ